MRLRHPEFKGRRYKEWKTRSRVGDRTFVGFRFDYEFERVPGTWVFQVLHDDKILAGKSFQVMEPE